MKLRIPLLALLMLLLASCASASANSLSFQLPDPSASPAGAQSVVDAPEQLPAPSQLPRADLKQVVIIGDSYMSGIGASEYELSTGPLLAERLNWDIVNLSQGTTGYGRAIDGAGAQPSCKKITALLILRCSNLRRCTQT